MPARSLHEILCRESSRPAELLARSESQSLLARRLSELLPTPFHGRVRLAFLEDERAVLLADSPVWKSRLRFHLPQIKRLIRTQLAPRVRRVEIRVAPRPATRRQPSQRRRLSQRSADCLLEAARSVDDDALRKALTRLAGNARDRRAKAGGRK